MICMYKIIALHLLLFALCSFCTAQKYLDREKKLIIGKWIAEDKSSVYVFERNSTCKEFISGKLSSVYTYKLTSYGSSCFKEQNNNMTKAEAEKFELSYLELKDIEGGTTFCYELNGVNEKILSLSYLLRPTPIVFNKVNTSPAPKRK